MNVFIFTDAEIALLEVFADAAALPIENSQSLLTLARDTKALLDRKRSPESPVPAVIARMSEAVHHARKFCVGGSVASEIRLGSQEWREFLQWDLASSEAPRFCGLLVIHDEKGNGVSCVTRSGNSRVEK